MSHHPKLAILGFGTMGQAISAGLVEASGYPADRIHVTTRPCPGPGPKPWASGFRTRPTPR